MVPTNFSGNDQTRDEYEEDLKAFDPGDFWRGYETNYQCIIAQAAETVEAGHGKRRKIEAADANSHRQKPGQKKIKKEKAHKADASKTESTPSTVTASPSPQPASETTFDNPFQGEISSKQNDETITEFVRRLPPSSTTSMDINSGWIWVSNPKIPHPYSQQIANFKESGLAVLESLGRQRAQLEAENPTKVASTITRMMRPYREGAEVQLAQLAKTNHVTSGKWMLFPQVSDVDRVWRTVAQATWDGHLGMTAKVATLEASDDKKPERLVCIYTHDFANVADVQYVLSAMRDLGLVQDHSAAKTIYYKCDFVTHLNLVSGNEYKIRASMYSSSDVFKQMAKDKALSRKK